MSPRTVRSTMGQGLASATPPSWAASLRGHLDELLIEQAQLEKRAASTATAFLFRVPQAPVVQQALSALAREELLHFERTLRLCATRAIPFRTQPPSPYAERLKAACRPAMPDRLVDELLVAALIEARSCERMAALADAFAGVDDELAAFWRDLVAAEARHQVVYADVAASLVPAAAVAARWRELAAHEARVLGVLPWSPRLHGGLPAAAHGRA
jgi:tRNA-(ms[2]io[6]A)-hydroxylase